jgi:acetoin utilization deacetylase AcuC-like enzyme
MGFCLFNNAAIVAQWVIENNLASLVAIVDFDVHHGNGTQEIFYSRSYVLYISSHKYPFYPGTGELQDMGEGAGLGYTVNFPLQAGTGDSFYTRVYRELIAPILIEFDPGLILVSAGYDAHRDDPLGGMLLSADGFGALSFILNEVSRKVADNRVLYILEGGYNLTALSDCVLRTIETAIDRSEVAIREEQVTEFESYRRSSKRYFSPYWKSLG